MQLKALLLAKLCLLFLGNIQVEAYRTDLIEGEPLSSSYISSFSSDIKEQEFVLSNEITHSFSKRADSCSKYHKVSGSDTCISIAKKAKIDLDTFYAYNSKINKSCTNLMNGKKYCVQKKKSQPIQRTAKKLTTNKKTAESRKKLQSNAAFTYYWIAQPDDYTKGKQTDVKTCKGDVIGSVPSSYADALVMEGTGVVGSKIVNLGGCSCSNYKCFELVDRDEDPYGLTSYDTPLRPYVTIASNDIKKNTKIYVPSMVGWDIPGSNKKHNGCLLVDDQSWSFKGNHIDFYVYSMSNYKTMDKAHRTNKVDIYEGGSCEILNYMS